MIEGILLGMWAGFLIGSILMYITLLKMVAGGHEKVFLKSGAFVCSICPLCIYARSKPESELAKILSRFESNCPFCIAFKRLNAIEKDEKKNNKDVKAEQASAQGGVEITNG